MQDGRGGGFGLYVHWPFCQSKCPYCDFNSHVAAAVDHGRWRDALVAEVARVAALVPGRVLDSIFFGGGTPSLMAPETVAAVIAAARAGWPAANDLEVTLEANPGSVEAGRFAAYRDAGVTRVSLGVQALEDADLRRLGRLHSAAESRAALEVARRHFDRVSFDLIYARQDQTPAAWRRELTAALDLAADHLSLYQLTIEDGTPFAARHAAGGLRGLPDEDAAVAMYEITQELCAAAGLPGYEISNHARPGSESRHNLIYWRSGDWAGVGPGAHGRLTRDGRRWATAAPAAPGAWLAQVERGQGGTAEATALDPRAVAEERLMMGLRLREGVAPEGLALDPDELASLAAQDLLWQADGRIGTTARGRLLLNAVLARLLARMPG